MKNKIHLVYIFFIFLNLNLFAEDIKVTYFSNDISGELSSISPIEDSNGDLCALVKIDLPIESCKFDGFIVDSKYDNGYYILNVSSQSRKIIIKCPGYDLATIDLSLFPNNKPLQSGEKYLIKVSLPDENTLEDNGNFAVINIIPDEIQNASLVIDNKTYEVKNGQVIDFLKYGQYTVTASAEGFQSKSESFSITPDKTTTVDIYLNSETAKLFVECDIAGSTIFINGDKKSKNSWQSSLSEGNYLVEVTRVGYKTYSEIIHLNKNETKNLTITLQER